MSAEGTSGFGSHTRRVSERESTDLTAVDSCRDIQDVNFAGRCSNWRYFASSTVQLDRRIDFSHEHNRAEDVVMSCWYRVSWQGTFRGDAKHISGLQWALLGAKQLVRPAEITDHVLGESIRCIT
jgi:hypothetical protein